jgi:hypothetical protein
VATSSCAHSVRTGTYAAKTDSAVLLEPFDQESQKTGQLFASGEQRASEHPRQGQGSLQLTSAWIAGPAVNV